MPYLIALIPVFFVIAILVLNFAVELCWPNPVSEDIAAAYPLFVLPALLGSVVWIAILLPPGWSAGFVAAILLSFIALTNWVDRR